MIHRICGAAVLVIFVATSLVACTSGCEHALEQTKKLTDVICNTEPGYHESPFCAICVEAGFYSTTGPADCRCTRLAFDQGVCSVPSDDEAKSAVRGAIKWANESCLTFTFVSEGGTGGQAGSTGQGGSSAEAGSAMSGGRAGSFNQAGSSGQAGADSSDGQGGAG